MTDLIAYYVNLFSEEWWKKHRRLLFWCLNVVFVVSMTLIALGIYGVIFGDYLDLPDYYYPWMFFDGLGGMGAFFYGYSEVMI